MNEWLQEMYVKCVNKAFSQGELTVDAKDYFLDLQPADDDELDEAYKELVRVIQNHRWYLLIARIEKADQVIADETDKAKRDIYVRKRNEFANQLERMDPARAH